MHSPDRVQIWSRPNCFRREILGLLRGGIPPPDQTSPNDAGRALDLWPTASRCSLASRCSRTTWATSAGASTATCWRSRSRFPLRKRSRLVISPLDPLVDLRGVLPEVLLLLRARLGGVELLHQADLLGDGGHAVAVGVVGAEHDAVLAEGLEEILQPRAQELIVLDDEAAVSGLGMVDLGELDEDVGTRRHLLDDRLVGRLAVGRRDRRRAGGP